MMLRFWVTYCSSLVLALSAASALAQGVVDLTLCNKSSTHAVSVAWVYTTPGNALLPGGNLAHARGWWVVEPNSCNTLFENQPGANSHFLRLQSAGRLIPATALERSSYWQATDSTFCVHPEDAFARSEKTSEQLAQCKADEVSAPFPFYFRFDGSTALTLHVDPDPIVAGRAPDSTMKAPVIKLAEQKIRRFGLSDAKSLRNVQEFVDALDIKSGLGLPGAQSMIDCVYTLGDVTYFHMFWHKSIPLGFAEFQGRSGGATFPHLGARAVEKCPATSREAQELSQSSLEAAKAALANPVRSAQLFASKERKELKYLPFANELESNASLIEYLRELQSEGELKLLECAYGSPKSEVRHYLFRGAMRSDVRNRIHQLDTKRQLLPLRSELMSCPTNELAAQMLIGVRLPSGE